MGVGENGTQLYVYDVKNAKAIDLSDHLNAIFTGRTSGGIEFDRRAMSRRASSP